MVGQLQTTENQPKETAYTEKGVRSLRENLRAGVTHPKLMVTGRAPKRPGWSVGVYGEPRGPGPVPPHSCPVGI